MSVGSEVDPSLGSQPAGDIVMKPAVGHDLSARPAVIFPAREHHSLLAGTDFEPYKLLSIPTYV